MDTAEEAAKKAHKTESQAVARLKVKAEEATRLTNECSLLRAEVALMREKGEASSRVVKALAASCEKLKSELVASESKHDWSKLQEPVTFPKSEDVFSSSSMHQDITLEDVELALAEPCEEAVFEASAEAPLVTLGRRLRSKGPESRRVGELIGAVAQVEKPSAVSSFTSLVGSAVSSLTNLVGGAGSSRRVRSATPEPPTINKRARVADLKAAVAAAGSAQASYHVDDVVDYRDEGDEWSTGKVTSVSPLKVNGCTWDEVRKTVALAPETALDAD